MSKLKNKIIFLNWDSWYGKLIRLYNLKKYGEKGYSHTGIITKEKDGLVQIHEALSKGFIKSWYPKEFIENKIADGSAAIKESKIKLKDVEENADKYLGRPYAWYDIFGIALSSILGWKFLKLTGASKLICSEAVARILYDSSNKKINFAKEYSKSYDLITPMDIFLSSQLKSI